MPQLKTMRKRRLKGGDVFEVLRGEEPKYTIEIKNGKKTKVVHRF